MSENKKYLDQEGLQFLWSKINMQDYPNNDVLITVINAIDEGKMDKTTAVPLIEQATAGQVPIVKSVDENGKPVEWEAQDFTKIPDTTNTKQYLVTNSNGEKVWTDLPMTETININLTDATLIMPGVIQYYGILSPAEIIEKSRYVVATNFVFIREIRGHKGDQMGVILDKIKDRGYEAFTNANGNRCLRVYFDNYAPIIIDASSEPPFYLDPEYVAPEPIIPEITEPNQYLTTNENGEKVWENKPDIATLQSAIDTLNGTGEGSVRETVADAVATIVANAPEDFDTLKEIADWIANDTTGSLNLIERVDKVEQDLIDLNIPTEEIEDLYSRLNSNATLGFYCVEDVTIVLNGVSTTYPANSNVEIKLLDTDVFEIVPTSDHSILSLNAFPGALGTYYSWLEGVKQFSNILFDMNDEAF